MATTFGYDSPEEMMAKVRNVAHLYPDRRIRERFKQAVDEDGFVHNFECELRRNDGSTILDGDECLDCG